jgi:hypothetical protein
LSELHQKSMLSVEIFLNNTTHGTISKVETMLTRRDILKSLGLAPAALPFLGNLSSLAANTRVAKEIKKKTGNSIYP